MNQKIIHFILFAAACSIGFSQTPVAAPSLTPSPTQPGIPAPDPANPPIAQPVLSADLPLAWNDTSKPGITVAVPNNLGRPLQIMGVQTTANLFVVSFDKTVPPHQQGTVVLNYQAEAEAETDVDLVRLQTSLGIQVIRLVNQRDRAAAFDKKSLAWALNETPAVKSVSIQLAANTASVVGVKVAPQAGDRASVVAIGPGQYRIDITPASTAQARQFIVAVQFTPLLPGTSSVISCSIAAP